MAKNTSILLGDYFDDFINKQVKTGKYASASEVVRAALRMFEKEESKRIELIEELKKGEKSGFIEDFDRTDFLNNLEQKHRSKNEV
ncbi:type II toxin-antitoxin system ParD family antitoxin [Paucihalobacter ruber]|uniref:Type II toxin-antitoxin system ParD family antitoxin n=1 Tax=Paucihalobacter ruber TaxID=2567861 RepID=A0A506PJU2_9FLAO|nr:type II toxin-antitoxin system ParD family antitoxin [Paucihalobacter ruber]TPV33834.1 type II toxin-antitoxin system ParD family antitoxin [Paucihalobacter ruber]